MDGVFRKEVSQNLLSLFCVGQQAAQYVDLDDQAIVDRLLRHLDAAFDGAASRNLLQVRAAKWHPALQGLCSRFSRRSYTVRMQRLAV
jgi:hypothetical protein